MTVTFTSAAERTGQRTRHRADRLTLAYLSFAITSLVAMLAMTLAYVGRFTVFDNTEKTRAGAQLVNLNEVADPRPLESAIERAFPHVHDRQFASEELFRFIADERHQGRTLPNVGAIARATLNAATIERAKGLDAFARRLQLTRQTAAAAGRVPPEVVPLFSGSDIATLKPFFTVRSREDFRDQFILFGCIYILAFQGVTVLWRVRGVRSDYLLLAIAHLLTAIGFAVLLSRPDPLRDSLLFVRFVEAIAIGLAVMTAVSLIDFSRTGFAEFSFLPLIGALALSAVLILFGSGPGSSNAKVNLGPLQPIEVIRLLLALFLAGYFARKWELLRQLRTKAVRSYRLPEWINVPRGEYVLPVVAGVSLALVFFFLQKDLGPALSLCCAFLAMYAIARGRAGMAIIGFLLLVLGFYLGYRLDISTTLAARVRMWQSPWDNGVPGGNQVPHAIWGLATGGWFGTGLGLGDSRYLPAGHTDLILAAIGEELGAIGLTVVAVLYAILCWRGIRIGRLARTDHGFFLAIALTLFWIMPALIMASGILGVTPLTGIVTPFLSYGGSAMVANFCGLGMLTAIHADRNPPGDFEPFRIPIYTLAGVIGVCALVLFVVMVNIQIVHGNEYVVRPHLGIQADGGRRFEYNPRVLDVVQLLPRGTIYDRHGVPLATDDPKVIANARDVYARLGISLTDACPKSNERCYPMGGRAFHLLGDERTHLNWSAPNSSYVERDAESQLRGFDDHASAFQTTDSAGRRMLTVRRDYREIVPALRHRYDPNHAAVARLRNRPRDVRLTIDANLQLRVAAIVASYATKTAGRAAAIVTDPDTGELLASASFPWPTSEMTTESLLDRARYGLYPPGSTFKLVTASAALRQHVDLNQTTFMCARLPDGRVGAKIKGWSRPIRDDVLDTHPHGLINMQEGFVHSCNAYFAQLAVKLGSASLLDTTNRLGISLTPVSDATQRVRQTLPQVGYGQGDVVVTPLRMARVAAAVASNGVLRDIRWKKNDSPASAPEQFLDRDGAELLAGYMRNVVLNGTGRTLRNHSWRIAGKTGTAELSNRPSHGWFVGYAPYGQATKRVAFAVLIENAGYGGGSAAPAAGEIVTAAALTGLIK